MNAALNQCIIIVCDAQNILANDLRLVRVWYRSKDTELIIDLIRWTKNAAVGMSAFTIGSIILTR